MAIVSLNARRAQIRSWKTLGDGAMLTGTFEGVHPGQYGELCDLVLETGEVVTVPAHAMLIKLLSEVQPGSRITIVHEGLRPMKNGTTEYRRFDVRVDEADIRSAPERRAPEPEAPSEADTVGAEDMPF